jgi:DNA-binding winged helix-turn-helix (wHTH) protein
MPRFRMSLRRPKRERIDLWRRQRITGASMVISLGSEHDGPWVDAHPPVHGHWHSVRFRFDPFLLDTEDETLVHDGVRVMLRGKAFAVLRVLVENAGHLVTRERLLDEVWGDAVIHEQGLSVCVKEVRAALGDDSRSPRYVKTEHRRGYRLLVPVTLAPGEVPLDTITHDERVGARSLRWIAFVWSVGRPISVDTPLVDGARDLGRGPLGTFALDDPAVSRRHLRITCIADRWRVEDCGSRNGSWVDGAALAGASVDARAGTLVRIGETLLLLADDTRALQERRARCALLATCASGADLRASFVERALLDDARRSTIDWEHLIERARAHAGGGPVTAASWPDE